MARTARKLPPRGFAGRFNGQKVHLELDHDTIKELEWASDVDELEIRIERVPGGTGRKGLSILPVIWLDDDRVLCGRSSYVMTSELQVSLVGKDSDGIEYRLFVEGKVVQDWRPYPEGGQVPMEETSKYSGETLTIECGRRRKRNAK